MNYGSVGGRNDKSNLLGPWSIRADYDLGLNISYNCYVNRTAWKTGSKILSESSNNHIVLPNGKNVSLPSISILIRHCDGQSEWTIWSQRIWVSEVDHYFVDIGSDVAVGTLVDVTITTIAPPRSPGVLDDPVGFGVSYQKHGMIDSTHGGTIDLTVRSRPNPWIASFNTHIDGPIVKEVLLELLDWQPRVVINSVDCLVQLHLISVGADIGVAFAVVVSVGWLQWNARHFHQIQCRGWITAKASIGSGITLQSVLFGQIIEGARCRNSQ